ncbi:MAG: hypothetical protein WBA89_06070 [Microcoleus sp.]|uniref:hypothetical protein n=1 Tax=unclassified Microcoleus TaxID=2642155 RepID=UPI002FD639D2
MILLRSIHPQLQVDFDLNELVSYSRFSKSVNELAEFLGEASASGESYFRQQSQRLRYFGC